MTWKIEPGRPLEGEITVPGDKSVTHRAYLFAAMAKGRSVICRPLRAEDTDNTLNAVAALGAGVEDGGDHVVVTGTGLDGIREPEDVMDLGNSGTGVRLIAGLIAARPVHAVLTGDGSLRGRPMGRIVEPLRQMGAMIDGRKGGNLLPLSIRGGELSAISYESPVASAQVKSCVLIAALGASGTTVFTEPALSRDHTERMLRSMGVTIDQNRLSCVISGGQELVPTDIDVPGDISSAAFFLAAGALVEGSDITVRNVGVNPTRTGIIKLLEAMGADLTISPLPGDGEPRADIRVRGTRRLKGMAIPSDWIPSIIDELPLAAVIGAAAEGVTELGKASELRVKESDRISTTVKMLRLAGIDVQEKEDGFRIEGTDKVKPASFKSHGDHRIAMSSAVLALLGPSASHVRETGCVATSFPGFGDLFNTLAPGSLTPQGEI
ncbi:MAG: 3-phosphoshikimate 1-carboxyvinyltransferase [bacterium]|nr:3-phosphoshikimate 1-carboxyvinyltransferase [bacterium]MDT8395720.1 3-phosphoshikimate 1-carboxyvinyltransferase [bacterium]